MNQFFAGVIFAAYAVVALLFFRFWSRLADRLFLFFGVAFATLAMERLILSWVSPDYEFIPFIYLVRLTAFVIIVIGIVDKNRSA